MKIDFLVTALIYSAKAMYNNYGLFLLYFIQASRQLVFKRVFRVSSKSERLTLCVVNLKLNYNPVIFYAIKRTYA